MAEPTRNRIDGLWGVRYGEILLARFDGTSFSAEVWNTMGFNDCPPTEFAELDARAIAAERGALVALKNGPRHWVLDAIEAQMRVTAPTTKFGTLEMFLAATWYRVGFSPTHGTRRLWCHGVRPVVRSGRSCLDVGLCRVSDDQRVVGL